MREPFLTEQPPVDVQQEARKLLEKQLKEINHVNQSQILQPGVGVKVETQKNKQEQHI